jgi:Pentapeptide repeats (8 copies)
MLQIKHRWTGKVLWAFDRGSLQGAELRGVNLRDANLHGANLQGANLQGANLRDANLQGAKLRGANLQGAKLRDAKLRGADLTGADLQGANLQGANLQGANLQGANLRGANLRDARLPNGRTLSEYLAWLPEGLLVQGGKPLAEVVAAWDGHTWDDCPMSVAFNALGLASVPECWRAEAAAFVALFDGGHIPRPEVGR